MMTKGDEPKDSNEYPQDTARPLLHHSAHQTLPKDTPKDAHKTIPEDAHPFLTHKTSPPSLAWAGNEGRDPGDEDEVVLTPAMEEEIIGPESFTWCGLGCVRGGWLQKLARPEVYLLVFSCMGLSQGMFSSYTTGTLTTMERRFKLSSAVSGFISTGNDVIQILLSLHVSFMCGNGHRPRWLAAAHLLAIVGCILYVAPHFIFGPGDYSHLHLNSWNSNNNSMNGTRDWEWCGREANVEENCEQSASGVDIEQYTVAAMQFLAQVFSGLSSTCYAVVGYSYMDEAVSKEKVPLYLAVSGCMRIFGPLAGAGLASWSLRQWVQPGVTPIITPTHPEWVGAWWIGFLVMGLMLLVTSWSLMLLPRMLPGTRKRAVTRLRAAARKGRRAFNSYCDSLRPITRPSFINMLPGLRRLFRNRIFVSIFANQMFFWLVLASYHMFSRKYMEHQFNIAAADASKYTAMIGSVASLVGWLVTGSMLTLFKPRTKVILYITMSTSLAISAVFFAMMAVKCEVEVVHGLAQVVDSRLPAARTSPDGDHPHHPSAGGVPGCMAGCSCSDKFSPVCVDAQHSFFSACYAGCTQQEIVNGSQVYNNCSCASPLHSTAQEEEGEQLGEAVSGKCGGVCTNLWKYLVLSTLQVLLACANRAIANVIFLRSVTEKDKDLSLGLLNGSVSGTLIVAPVVLGALLDYSCVLWQWTCDVKGFCHLYDIDGFNYLIHGLPAVGMLLVFSCDCLLLRWHKDLDFFGEKEIEELGLSFLLKKIKKKERKNLTPEDLEL